MPQSREMFGSAWVLGVAGAVRYPTDGQGGGDVSPGAATELIGARGVLIEGVLFTVIDTANTVEVVDTNGVVLPGLSFAPNAATLRGLFHPFGANGVQYDHEDDAAVGIKCNGTNVAVLFFRRAY